MCNLEHTNTVKPMNETLFGFQNEPLAFFFFLICFDLFSAVNQMCNKNTKDMWIENRRWCLEDQQK